YRDDDDINDVASMAGVNLNEESARIMATSSDLVGTQIQSCKDEPFLAAIPLHKRILEMAKKLGITDVPAEVVTFISHATQNRLRTVIEKVTVITQHRMESYKDDEWYEQATDVRSQLKFFEQLERLEKQRKDEQEREILLKAAKSRSRQEDPEQARLKQKAKEMQQQELAQMRQRDANLTALAAIGPRKKRKLDSPGLLTIGGEGLGVSGGSQAGLGTPSSRQYARQKITRVNLRDFIFYMEQERETSHSLLLYRALLK
ncbi:TAF4 factor, partial [Nyctibius grandis]|nr:TAF4 factor [Nyctibius bracteatus]NXQ84156.1 TAF4 factor [Nyctibius grandis]